MTSYAEASIEGYAERNAAQREIDALRGRELNTLPV
jgi:hypothetical protein